MALNICCIHRSLIIELVSDIFQFASNSLNVQIQLSILLNLIFYRTGHYQDEMGWFYIFTQDFVMLLCLPVRTQSGGPCIP